MKHIQSPVAIRYLILGQVGLISGFLICYLLSPALLRTAGGLSNYGVHRQTVVFYSLALLLAGLFTWLAARQLVVGGGIEAKLPVFLMILAALYIMLLLSTYPYKLNLALNTLHRGCAITLFGYEVLLSLWLAKITDKNWLNALLLIAFLLGSTVSLLSLLNVTHILFIGQSLAGLAFAGVLVRSVSQLQPQN